MDTNERFLLPMRIENCTFSLGHCHIITQQRGQERVIGLGAKKVAAEDLLARKERKIRTEMFYKCGSERLPATGLGKKVEGTRFNGWQTQETIHKVGIVCYYIASGVQMPVVRRNEQQGIRKVPAPLLHCVFQ
jgi:predicted ThiF/HesA family dinucleotide-utilizing enzyme